MSIATSRYLIDASVFRIPIPNVCKSREFGIPVIDIFTMLERLNIQFKWSPADVP